MTIPRANQVSLTATPYYHCICRCVRRAFLCGEDAYSGKNFDHRKQWVVARLRFLSEVFAMDVCAYAVMSNHLHLVLRIAQERAERWSEREVLQRYGRLFRGAQRQLEGLEPPQRAARLKLWRHRLSDLSWMMRSLNEWIARRANEEDGCTGRFWEGRFKSQALLDDEGLLTCMAYVDLNPVRAGTAKSLETSEFTSIRERLRAAAKAHTPGEARTSTPRGLAPFADDRRSRDDERIGIDLSAYVDLLESTGRALRRGDGGQIEGAPAALLMRFGLDPAQWLRAIATHAVATATALGSLEAFDEEASRRGQQWMRGKGLAQRLRGCESKASGLSL